MKKPLLVLILPAGLPVPANSQGEFHLDTHTAPTRIGLTNGPLAGRGIWGQALAGFTAYSLTPVGFPTEHWTNGWVVGETISVSFASRTIVLVQMAAWDGRIWGTSFAGVPVNQLGFTDIVPVFDSLATAKPTPSHQAMNEVTKILRAAESGDADDKVTEKLLPLVSDDLRRLAALPMAGQRPGQTLQATALVHEAYLRLVGQDEPGRQHWDGRGHFFAAAAEAMRPILIDRARQKQSLKRGGDQARTTWDESNFDNDGSQAGPAPSVQSENPLTLGHRRPPPQSQRGSSRQRSESAECCRHA